MESTAASSYFIQRRHRAGKPWKRRSYRHYPQWAIVCRTRDHFILAFATAQGPQPDVDEFRSLLAKAAQRVRLRCVVADAGYDSESNHRYAREDLGCRSIFPANQGRPTRKPATGKYRRRMQVRLDRAT